MDHVSMLMERAARTQRKSTARRLATGAIVGIAIACFVVFLGFLLCCYCCCFRRRRQRSRELEDQQPQMSSSNNGDGMMGKFRSMMPGNQNNGAPLPSTPTGGPDQGFHNQYPHVQQPTPAYR
ncbi:hypothetical protein GGTG_07158 [Gaeumannomyces tritici R3-111a-1]|uniref:Uncharacterized protein n=1 Tax=Gaeumannomyces tritici (strain R3-111a-1) TaxID=644352 RepID=J3P0W2_GAET3|nr:hypothetical protein GGTG_07158 [Gaeumannomyces tritici R3-111a-1]EJT77246.1 hypothetical protein GGTG_07158 [Gaeumannomyces tritici R3-111a-1]